MARLKVSPPGRDASFALLREADFLRLFTAQTISFFGTALTFVALPFAVLDVTGSAPDLAVVNVARTAPALVFVLAGGVIGDRISRRAVFVASNLALGGCQAATAAILLAGLGSTWNLALLAGLGSAAIAIEMPVAQALIPEVASPARLREANALMRMSRNGSLVFGAAGGGLLVAALGPGWAIALDAVSFAAAALIVAGVRPTPAASGRSDSPLAQLRAGWAEFSSRTWLWTVVLQFCVVNAAYAVGFQLMGPILARQYLGGARAWGLILTGVAAGYLAGGVVALRYRPARPLLTGLLGVLIFALPLPALALRANLVVVIAAGFVSGIGIEQFGVAWSTALAEHVPRSALSRVSSYDMLGSFLAVPVGFGIGGLVVTRISATAIVLTCATLIVAVTCACLASSEVRSLPRQRLAEPDERPARLSGAQLS